MLKYRISPRIYLVALLLFFSPDVIIAKSTHTQILSSYADIAYDNYSDALGDAKELEKAIEIFIASPTKDTFSLARKAWLKSRESYGQTEIFRLSSGPIDAEEGWVADTYGALEGQLNAWPLDENMIDYTINAKGERTSGNIIDAKGMFTPEGKDSQAVDISNITSTSITALNENGGDANVATGYHALEFLLWGQDQDYASFVADSITTGATIAGQRPLSDYTTDPHADRRKTYLHETSKKIGDDLTRIHSAWSKELSADCSKDATGCYRAALLSTLKDKDASKNIKASEAIKTILSGMGVFIKSELANERIAVAVLTPSEEDEHSCFSDNTHRDITANYQGFKNILTASYNNKVYGKSLLDSTNKEEQKVIINLMSSIEEKIAKMNALATSTEHFDYQVRPDNPNAKNLVSLKNDLRKLGDKIVTVAKDNGIVLGINDITDEEETQI